MGGFRITWEVKKLGDVCDLITDGVHNSPPYVDIGIPMLDSKHIDNSFQIDDSNPRKFISEETDQLLAQRCKPKENDILISSRGSIGKIAIVKKGQNFNIMGNIILLRLPVSLDAKFLVYSLHSELKNIESIAKGVAQKGLYLNQVRNFPIPLPSISEQKRIVAILDEAFENIAKAKESAEKNLKNANEIFESYLQSVFENKDEGWEEKTLGSLSKFVSVGYVGPISKFYCEKHEGIPFLRSQNVRPAKLSMKGIRYILPEFHTKLKKSQLKSGDLLFVRVGANRGDCCSLPENLGEINCANIVFSRPTEASPKFLEFFCLSQMGRERLLGMTTGSAQGVINTKSVAELLVPLPNIKEQLAIEKKFNLISSETNKLEAIYIQKLADLEELKKSILAKAFEGKLTEASA